MRVTNFLHFFMGVAFAMTSFLVTAHALFAEGTKTIIRGNVYDQSNNGFGKNGIPLQISCTNTQGQVISKQATTVGTYQGHDAGLYQIAFGKQQCPSGSSVRVSAVQNGATMIEQRTVSTTKQYHNNAYLASADFYVGATTVPEFTPITGTIALLGSVGLFFILKRKSFL